VSKIARRFLFGFGFIGMGFRLFRAIPGLKIWLVIPFILDFLLLFAGIYFGTGEIRFLVRKVSFLIFTSADSLAFQIFYYPMVVLLWLIFFVLYFYVVYLIASVLASPIYSIMAEKTTRHLESESRKNTNLISTVTLSARMLWISLIRSLLLLVVGLFLFVGSVVPGVNLIAAFIAFVLLAFDSADYALEVHGLRLRARFKFLRRNLVEFVGMGAAMGLTALVPGLILIIMPFAVVGATHVVFEIEKRNKNDSITNT
jgi:uncharacterized protein involved in cysteine biosynthesis